MQDSNENIVVAIREDDLSQFAMDILSLSDDISDIFTAIDEKMNSLKMCFNCSEYEKLMNSYRSFRKNYSVVKHNLISYSDDLITVINKVKAGDKNIAFMIDGISELTLNKAKNVEKL